MGLRSQRSSLHPQDVVVVLKAAVWGPTRTWMFSEIAKELRLSTSEAHDAVQRALRAGLLFRANPSDSWPQPSTSNLLEFAVHGVKYAFPAERGGLTRGYPTAVAAPILQPWFGPPPEHPPVWPHPTGSVWGEGLLPFYPGAVEAALADERLYAGLALMDALRFGRARERSIAETVLGQLLAGGGLP